MSLHKVNVTIPVYIYLENDRDETRLERLRELAEEAIADERAGDSSPWSYHSTKIEDIDEVCEEWKCAIPWGDNNDSCTCEEILSKKVSQKDINSLIYSALVGIQLKGKEIDGLGEEEMGVSLDINGESWDIVAIKRT